MLSVAEFEVRVRGHNLIKVEDSAVLVDGKNFHADLKDIASLINILSDILQKAQESKKLRAVGTKKSATSVKKYADKRGHRLRAV